MRLPDSESTRYLLVIAHARSGSSLLVHLLHANPDILGIGEHHVSYDSVADLRSLLNRSRFLARDPRLEPQWVLDKIVWKHHAIADEVLADPRLHLLFLVREPSRTLPSLGRVLPGCRDSQSQLRYYQTRLGEMVELATRMGDPSRMDFVDYDDLVSSSESVLRGLTSSLGLEHPLEPVYKTTAKTGKMSWGDPGPHIQSGRIQRIDRDDPPLPPEVRDPAFEAYRAATDRLRVLTQPITLIQ